MADEQSRKAVEVAERFADGLVPREELAGMFAALQAVQEPKRYRSGLASPRDYTELAALVSVQDDFFGPLYHPVFDISRITGMAALEAWGPPEPNPPEFANQAVLLRDIMGNPFRPACCPPSVQTARVVAIARTIYDERRFGDLSILADALEDGSCSQKDILRHCRLPGEHVRGCWVVDLVLNKQ
jgi:hypothetical protein